MTKKVNSNTKVCANKNNHNIRKSILMVSVLLFFILNIIYGNLTNCVSFFYLFAI